MSWKQIERKEQKIIKLPQHESKPKKVYFLMFQILLVVSIIHFFRSKIKFMDVVIILMENLD